MITSNKINRIQDKIKSLIKKIEKEEEVKISFGTCRYNNSEYKTTMKVNTTAKDKSTVKAVGNVNTNLSKSYGFDSNIIGKSWMNRGIKHTIVEFKTRNRKYPVISENILGKRYKHTIGQVKLHLK